MNDHRISKTVMLGMVEDRRPVLQ